MAGKRIYQVAKEFKISSEALLKIVRELRFEPKSHMSVATDDMIAAVHRKFDIEKENAKKDILKRKNDVKARSRTDALKRKHNSGLTDSATKTKPSTDSSRGRDDRSSRPAAGSVRTGGQSGFRPGGFSGGGQSRPGGGSGRPGGGPGRPGGGQGRPGGGPGGRKRRDRKKRGRNVDQSEVSKSFRSTLAAMSGQQKTKKYRRRGASEGDLIDVENIVSVTEYMTLGELAKTLNLKPAEIITKMFQLGQMATINQRLDIDAIEMISLEFGFGIEQETEVGEFAKEVEQEKNLQKRPPVVTVMGHVDHGKTSLLDYIRETDVVSGEAGAITQHIGAYQIHLKTGEPITFLDTPGHEAFTAMRARGAAVTDLVILVVAADDGVMPQTVEAIDHAKAANAPIVVAINKIDKPEANVERIKQELTSHGLVTEEWGGDQVMVPVSAKTGEGIDKLLEMVVITADLLELKADPDIRAQGAVVEAKLERGRGPVATVLVTTGKVSVGDAMVAGANFGRVRSLTDEHGNSIKSIGPGTPGQITGLNGVPLAGDSFLIASSDTDAREISTKRSQIKREYAYRKPLGNVTLENIFERIQEGKVKELIVIVKGDVAGSVEAVSDKLTSIEHSEVRVRIIHRGVGAINESDVLLASTSNAIIIGFHVGPTSRARQIAHQEKVDIRTYEIIYEVEQDVTKALEGLLAPTFEERHTGTAEVRDIFKSPKVGMIAGCYVKDGSIRRDHRVNLMRDGKKIYSGSMDSLRRFKEDVREVQTGFECGIHVENYNDVKVGDSIETFELVEVARTLQER